jgi:nicotinamidase-related amidase
MPSFVIWTRKIFRNTRQSWLSFLLAASVTWLSSVSFSQALERNNAALVIIDMQDYFATRGGNDQTPENIKKTKKIFRNLKAAIKSAQEAKIPIIFLEYENYGPTNSKLVASVSGYDQVGVFLKNTDGVFSESNRHREQLVEFLTQKDVGKLFITGANGGACVFSSISGALQNQYDVIALSKGIADFNYREFVYPYEGLYHFEPAQDCVFREIDSGLQGIFQRPGVLPGSL